MFGVYVSYDPPVSQKHSKACQQFAGKVWAASIDAPDRPDLLLSILFMFWYDLPVLGEYAAVRTVTHTT